MLLGPGMSWIGARAGTRHGQERGMKSINIQIPSGKMDIIGYIQQRGGYVSSYIPRERQDTPLTSFTVIVDVPEDRQEEILNQVKQRGGHVIDAPLDDKA
jgi:hypothetical protein